MHACCNLPFAKFDKLFEFLVVFVLPFDLDCCMTVDAFRPRTDVCRVVIP
jgi:hypothetical protein